MNILAVLILLGLAVVLFFQVRNFVIAIKQRKNEKMKKEKSNSNIEKGVKK